MFVAKTSEVGVTASENGLCTSAFVVVASVKGIPVAKIWLRGPGNIKRNHSIHSTTEGFFSLRR